MCDLKLLCWQLTADPLAYEADSVLRMGGGVLRGVPGIGGGGVCGILRWFSIEL